MPVAALRLLLAASLAAPVIGGAGQDSLDPFRRGLAQLPPAPAVALLPAPADAGTAAAIAQWRALAQTDALPFDAYAGFLLAHPGWPDEAHLRRAAERQAVAGTGSAGGVAAFFRRVPPQTGQGWLADARALAATGQPTAAAAAVRRAWRTTSLGAGDEAYVLATFPAALTADDHDARCDALLWAGQATAAARVLPLTSLARRPALAARLALRSGAPDAAAVAAADAFPTDAGFAAARATWLRLNGQRDAARQALAAARPAAPPGSPGPWLEQMAEAARGAAGDYQWQLAYDLAAQVEAAYPVGTDPGERPYAERDAYTDLAWLGGQAALKHLGRPGDAATLFDRYARGSHSPPIRAKGFYWAGRAAAAGGRELEASAWFAQAAGYRDQFYGQLAAERMGKVLLAPPALAAGGPAAVAPAVRAAFDARDVVRAARFLGRISDHAGQTPFVRQIAQDAKSDTDHLLAAELGRELGRPDLGVMVGRSALVNGLSDYSAAGFPTVAVPAGYEGSWTIIHAIARQESQFDRAAVSHAGARGLMQLMPGTAREQSGRLGLAYTASGLTDDPALSMMLGSAYFRRVLDQYASYPLAIAAYNAGGGNVNKWLAANGDPRSGAVDMVDWIEAIPFGETRSYVQRVLENAVVYDLIDPTRGLSGGRPAPLNWYLGRQPG